jgi:hypothetical protein
VSVTSLLFENFAEYSGMRDTRVLALARARADDGLAGRGVWCATALQSSAPRARMLLAALHASPIELEADEPLRRIGQRLDPILAGASTDALDAADAEDLAGAMLRSERIVGEAVGSGDVVVLEDPLGVVLAPALRERGAHAILEVRPASSARGRASIGAAEPLLRRCGAAVDARVMVWHGRRRGGDTRILALITSEDVVAAKEITARGSHPDEICWTTVLAEIVELGRLETVGGRLHARPTVAAR